MNMEDYEPKQRFRRVITNTFPSEEDCDIFIMLLKTQWPKHIDKMPKSELEITRSMESPNIMVAIWTFYEAKHFQILERFLFLVYLRLQRQYTIPGWHSTT